LAARSPFQGLGDVDRQLTDVVELITSTSQIAFRKNCAIAAHIRGAVGTESVTANFQPWEKPNILFPMVGDNQ
jgi:hypothetical protein